MKKSDRITATVDALGGATDGLDPHYAGYFTCFNAQRYYEAHDVLEQLWLRTEGGDHLFFKGLIQFAGAFVHMQKHFLQPTHPKHATRLRPAVRLLELAARNLAPYTPVHRHLDVAALLGLGERLAAEIAQGAFARNPWHPASAPQLQLALS